MKRRIASNVELGGKSLKRRSSSLFSIETIQESPSRPASQLDLSSSDSIPQQQPQQDSLIRSVSLCGYDDTAAAAAESTEVSSSASSTGFFIDEDDSDDEQLLTTLPLTTTTCIVQAKSIKQENNNTGLVVEAAPLHYDRSNKLHKERPLRVESVVKALESSSTYEKLTIVSSSDDQDSSPESEFLNDDDYLSVHLPGYMSRLDKLSNCTCCQRLDREALQFKSLYLTQDSVDQAKTAASSLCRLVTQVVEGSLDNGFAVIRPPGHHAEPSLAGGYCIINNVAVAASYARNKLGIDRVLIVDWDVHHGNGTQRIFESDPNVLYFSVHRWHHGNFFPFLNESGPTSVGSGPGEGFNVNVGWTAKGMGNDEYLAVWNHVLMPIACEFSPDLILVSAGFDAAHGDMGECNVTPECFGKLTKSLMTLADGKVVCALEGGYVRSVLAKCVESVVTTLLDPSNIEEEEEEDSPGLDTIHATAAKNIRATISAHESYWPCLSK